MNNATSEEHEAKFGKLAQIMLLVNGCFSLVLPASIFVVNIILIAATSRSHPPFNTVTHKLQRAYLSINLLVSILFLPYFGIDEILHGLQLTPTAFLFPSYLSITDVLFAQSNVNIALLMTVERNLAFTFPLFHRRMMTKTKVLITLFLTESFALLFACLQFTGISESTFYIAYIHLFISAPMLFHFILSCCTYWKIKNKKRVANEEIPVSAEQLELHKKRSTRTARKYLSIVSLFMLPLSLCILPWFIMKVIEVENKKAFTTDSVEFFVQRFSVSLLHLYAIVGPITITFRFEEYTILVKRLIRRWKIVIFAFFWEISCHLIANIKYPIILCYVIKIPKQIKNHFLLWQKTLK